ncbi:MAG TPA: hypothetical protein VL049_00730 [Candidatus Dormibacteraeota bacterium]|nr:hypothetical protein [Candidatus Dormibacteraeota bacterium]
MNDATGSTRRNQEGADAASFPLRINFLDATIVDNRDLIREDRLNADALRAVARAAPLKGQLKMLQC